MPCIRDQLTRRPTTRPPSPLPPPARPGFRSAPLLEAAQHNTPEPVLARLSVAARPPPSAGCASSSRALFTLFRHNVRILNGISVVKC